jgi:hypothetical protein
MYGSPDDEAAAKAQRFARVCELLVSHRDIYKKHVVGLLLEFVHGLEHAKMDTTRRDGLIPAIYFLLDTLSTYETQELNANMSKKAKTLFRQINNDYQKLHAYRGQ